MFTDPYPQSLVFSRVVGPHIRVYVCVHVFLKIQLTPQSESFFPVVPSILSWGLSMLYSHAGWFGYENLKIYT